MLLLCALNTRLRLQRPLLQHQQTALHRAAALGHQEVALWLVRAGGHLDLSKYAVEVLYTLLQPRL